MSEIKPVAYMFDWMLEKDDVSVTHPDQLKLGTIIDPINVRPLYPAAALEALQAENAALKEDLQFVERWANHHGTKSNVTAQEALSCIQHYPSIAAITKSYKDGVIPETRNPYAEIAAQAKRITELEQQNQIYRGAMLEQMQANGAEIEGSAQKGTE